MNAVLVIMLIIAFLVSNQHTSSSNSSHVVHVVVSYAQLILASYQCMNSILIAPVTLAQYSHRVQLLLESLGHWHGTSKFGKYPGRDYTRLDIVLQLNEVWLYQPFVIQPNNGGPPGDLEYRPESWTYIPMFYHGLPKAHLYLLTVRNKTISTINCI